jgi:hypothetical protein
LRPSTVLLLLLLLLRRRRLDSSARLLGVGPIIRMRSRVTSWHLFCFFFFFSSVANPAATVVRTNPCTRPVLEVVSNVATGRTHLATFAISTITGGFAAAGIIDTSTSTATLLDCVVFTSK